MSFPFQLSFILVALFAGTVQCASPRAMKPGPVREIDGWSYPLRFIFDIIDFFAWLFSSEETPASAHAPEHSAEHAPDKRITVDLNHYDID